MVNEWLCVSLYEYMWYASCFTPTGISIIPCHVAFMLCVAIDEGLPNRYSWGLDCYAKVDIAFLKLYSHKLYFY